MHDILVIWIKINNQSTLYMAIKNKNMLIVFDAA